MSTEIATLESTEIQLSQDDFDAELNDTAP
jgi:hypothetical protein